MLGAIRVCLVPLMALVCALPAPVNSTNQNVSLSIDVLSPKPVTTVTLNQNTSANLTEIPASPGTNPRGYSTLALEGIIGTTPGTVVGIPTKDTTSNVSITPALILRPHLEFVKDENITLVSVTFSCPVPSVFADEGNSANDILPSEGKNASVIAVLVRESPGEAPHTPVDVSDSMNLWEEEVSVRLDDLHNLDEVEVMEMTVEGCGHVNIKGDFPNWVRKLTVSSQGQVDFAPGWAKDTNNMSFIKVRAEGGVEGILNCGELPSSVQVLEIAYSPNAGHLFFPSCVGQTLKKFSFVHSDLLGMEVCIPSVVILDLSGNLLEGEANVTSWEGCPNGLRGVEVLHAPQNLLTSASTCGWPKLRTLNLRHNKLVSLDLETCPPLILTTLNVAHNQLEVPPVLPSTLQHLDLSRNNLTRLPVISHDLLDADLSHNHLSHIGKGSVRRARSLHTLILAHNRITTIYAGELVGLREISELDLSHNRISIIEGDSLNPLINLRHLQLQHNHLKILGAQALNILAKQTHAVLTHNPWKCTCHLLRVLQKAQACPLHECEKQEPLHCKESEKWHLASQILQTCLHAVHEVSGTNPNHRLDHESDEVYSDEVDERNEDTNNKAHFLIPSVVIVVLFVVAGVLIHRLYKRHRRTITETFCFWCPDARMPCECYEARDPVPEHNALDNLKHIQEDSDTETEL